MIHTWLIQDRVANFGVEPSFCMQNLSYKLAYFIAGIVIPKFINLNETVLNTVKKNSQAKKKNTVKRIDPTDFLS